MSETSPLQNESLWICVGQLYPQTEHEVCVFLSVRLPEGEALIFVSGFMGLIN